MRRTIGLVLLAAALLLGGCQSGESEVQESLDFRVKLRDSASCSFTAGVRADFGDKAAQFSLDCVYQPQDSAAALTVTGPDSIAGITATVEGGDATVSFDGVRLELGTLANGRVAPLQLPKLLGDAWAYGYIESQAKLTDGWLTSYRSGYGDDELLVYTWFNEQLVPTEAEIYYDDTRLLSAELKGFAHRAAG